MHRSARSLVLSHFPDEVKAARETQIPCPRSHQRDSPRRLTQNCALSCCACVSQFWGVPACPWVDALGLCFDQFRHRTSWKGLQEKPGAEPCAGGPLGAAGAGGSGQQAGALATLLQRLPPTGRVAKRLKTHSYFGRAFGPHLRVYFFFVVPSGAQQSTDVSPNKNRFDPSRALRPDVLMLSAEPRSLAKSSVGGCLEKMSRRSFFSRPFRLELRGLNAGSKRRYK